MSAKTSHRYPLLTSLSLHYHPPEHQGPHFFRESVDQLELVVDWRVWMKTLFCSVVVARLCSLTPVAPVAALDTRILIAWSDNSYLVTGFKVIQSVFETATGCLQFAVWSVYTVCVCVFYVRESLGHAASRRYFGYSPCVCVCVCIPFSLPQMMTLSAASPSNVPAEVAETVWWAVGKRAAQDSVRLCSVNMCWWATNPDFFWGVSAWYPSWIWNVWMMRVISGCMSFISLCRLPPRWFLPSGLLFFCISLPLFLPSLSRVVQAVVWLLRH